MQSELDPPDVCFSSNDVVVGCEMWNDIDPRIDSPDNNDNHKLTNFSNTEKGFKAVGGSLPDLCDRVDFSHCCTSTESINISVSKDSLEDEDADFSTQEDLKHSKIIEDNVNPDNKDMEENIIILNSKKINIISCYSGISSSSLKFPVNDNKESCDNRALTVTTNSDIDIMRENITNSNLPEFYLLENVAYVPSRYLGSILIHSHGTSLGYSNPHYGSHPSSRNLSLYDSETAMSEVEKIKLAKRYGLIHYLPCDSYDGNNTKTRECVICMIEFSEGDQLRYLPCMHTYHTECIDDWLMRSFTCPSCLEPVDAALLSTYETKYFSISRFEYKYIHKNYNNF